MLRRTRSRRALATVLFTDIVGSTERAEELGDAGWRALLDRHHRTIRRLLRRHRGREVDTAGDGFFATFEQPADAIACALEAADSVAALGIEIRAGIHTGEVEPMGAKVGGIAVHLGARILGAAEPGQIVASATVRDLVTGAGYSFRDLGSRPLKGVAEEWRLFAVERPVRVGPTLVTEPGEPRRLARPLLIGLGVAGLVVGSATVAYLVARGVGGEGVSDAPNVVRAIDAAGDLGEAFAVGRGASAVDVADGMLWVANTYGGTLSALPTRGGEGTVIGAGAPTDVAAWAGVVWVLDPFNGTVLAVGVSDARLLDTIDVRGRAIAASESGVWVADDINDLVHRIDPRSRSIVATIALPPGSGPAGIAATENAVWIVNTLSGTLSRIDPRSNEVVLEALALSIRPSAVAAGPDGVWVASEIDDAILRIDPATNRAVGVSRSCDQPTDLDVIGAGAIVICAGERAVLRLPAGDGEVIRTEVDAIPLGIAVDGERIWVTLRDS